MMKKMIIVLISIFTLNTIFFSQTVEKLVSTSDIKYIGYHSAQGSFPEGLYVDEIGESYVVNSPQMDSLYLFNILSPLSIKMDIVNCKTPRTVKLKLGNDYWGESIQPMLNGEYLPYINSASGISFILKKGNDYIVYFVDASGLPGAVDTEGKIYTNKEAIEYLKRYDSEKYAESLLRAEELGLKYEYENAWALVWGETYYTTTRIMEKFYGKNDPYILNGLIQYDKNGYGYQLSFDENHTDLCIVNPNGKRNTFVQIDNGYKHLLKNEYSDVSTSWYVGFGGNIYYYIAGDEYTEVFRIRRTWGDPDFYAMAINGYTEDDYGKYVDEVLPALSKSDLRLLRNTVFALYGVHFKSEDLSKHFDKQVWYTDEGKTSAEVTLPARRQKLVEMIQKLEK